MTCKKHSSSEIEFNHYSVFAKGTIVFRIRKNYFTKPMYSPYPSACIFSLGMNRNEALLMQ